MNFQPPITQEKKPIEEQKVRDFMTTRLITFEPDEDINQVINTLVNNKITGAPITDRAHKLVGMISERDCLRVLVDADYMDQPAGHHPVTRYMVKDVVTVGPDETIRDVASRFLNSNYKRFPVIYEGKLIGQISRSDVLRAAQQIHSQKA